MTETIYTPRLILATLRADSTLAARGVKVYRESAPQKAQKPYIVFRRYGGQDLDVIGGERQGELVRVTIKAVHRIERQEGDELLEEVATAMDACLTAIAGSSFPSTGTPRIHCDGFFRESPIDVSYPTSDNPDHQMRELGGIYAAYVQAL